MQLKEILLEKNNNSSIDLKKFAIAKMRENLIIETRMDFLRSYINNDFTQILLIFIGKDYHTDIQLIVKKLLKLN
jgi:hypothetical protein